MPSPPVRALTLSLTLAACSAAPTPASPSAQAPACTGSIDSPPQGAVEVQDDELLKQATGAPGKGALCTGKVYEAKQPLTVYRVWAKAQAHTETGRWWSFEKPKGPRDQYRQANAICAEWSPLDALSVCKLKAGSRFVLGPGQSATCQQGSFAASATNQVFIANDGRAGKLFVEQCERLGAFE